MDIVLPKPGTYVVAVSGGVDSMALLHRLHELNHDGQWKLLVAHLDHGIRQDSQEDRRLVETEARRLGIPFVYHEEHLGPGASEATARRARYDFLYRVQRASNARAIITAHHQDDLLETAILNMLRGGGRKGLTSLGSRHDIARPLLHIPKRVIGDYAQQNGIVWREDSTNDNVRYARNYVRHKILPRFNEDDRRRLYEQIEKLREINREIDRKLTTSLHVQSSGGKLDRDWFSHLPHAVAREIMAAWLRTNATREFDRRTLERLVIAAKVGDEGSQFDVLNGYKMKVNHKNLALVGSER